ncbi:MAG TPA: PleD family two-component system response regulator [Planctomycetota bacterium]|jgi:diguanylate cyclase (GGDEF)-like protein
MKKPRVLVVDDSATIRRLLECVLRGENDVLTASSGSAALQMALDESPDLILLDISMPEMDGHEVCRRLKAEPRTNGIPVIFVSALGEPGDEAAGLNLGAIDYIIKPISAPIVQARVRNHVELKRIRDTLAALSMQDGLTGLANRRRFDEMLQQEWRRGLRLSTPVALIMCDVDYFKKYNDHYGHLSGDECLKSVASAIKAVALRPGDLAARYGGEEFAMLLPHTDAEGAATVAEKIRTGVEKLRIEHARHDSEPCVTLSLGVAALTPEMDQPAEQLIARADKALYAAKHGGRNRVALAG